MKDDIRTTQQHFDAHTAHSTNLHQILTYVKNNDAALARTPHEVLGMLSYTLADEGVRSNNKPDSETVLHSRRHGNRAIQKPQTAFYPISRATRSGNCFRP